MKTKTYYHCKVCQYQSGKWLGKCPQCASWDSFEEVKQAASSSSGLGFGRSNAVSNLQPQSLATLIQHSELESNQIYPFKSQLLGDFWNVGPTKGSITLLAGEPGLGKSTLALQLLRNLDLNLQNCLYVSAEESLNEIAKRAKRLEIPENLQFLSGYDFPALENYLLLHKPQLLVLDSIQTIYDTNLPSNPGSVTQVSTVASRLLNLAKSEGITILIIGHVTKEGQIAGPKTLEHLVDSVLLLDRSQLNGVRSLSFQKHRYGSTENQLLLKMEENGLQIIADPSLLMLENMEDEVGICYGVTLDKNLPMIVEVQSLVSQNFASGFGRREASGISLNKLNTVLAIMEKYLKFDLKSVDVYLKISGISKKLEDESLDVPILLSLLSSIKNLKVQQFAFQKTSSASKTKNLAVFAGRLTLSGKIRKPTNSELRKKTAEKLKFNFVELTDINSLIGRV